MKQIISIAIYFAIGIGVGCFFYFVLKRYTLGEVWGASIVGIIGAVLGGHIIDKILEALKSVQNVNIGAAILGAALLVWVFVLVSPGRHKDRR